MSPERKLPAVAEAVLRVGISVKSSRDPGRRDLLLGMLEMACDDIVIIRDFLYSDR